MIPGDIGAHPEAPHHYIVMGKPESWNEEDCGSLAVRRVATTGDILYEPAVRIVRDQLPSGEEYYPAFMFEMIPSEDERARIAAGHPVRVLICGNGMPPVSVWVPAEDEV